VVITTKPRGHVKLDNIEEELPYQATKMSNIIPVTSIEQLQGLVDSTTLEVIIEDVSQFTHDDEY